MSDLVETASNEGALEDAERDEEQELQHWLYTPGEGAARWEEFRTAGIMALNWDRVGDLASFPDKESLLEALYTHYGDWGGRPRKAADSVRDYIHVMKPGDIVYVRRSFNEIVGRGVVRSDYRYDEDRSSFRAVRDVEWTHVGSWPLEQRIGRLMLQRLTENTKYTPDQLNALIGIEDSYSPASVDEQHGNNELDEADEHYTSTDFLDEVFLSPEDVEQMLGLLRRKKNFILQELRGRGRLLRPSAWRTRSWARRMTRGWRWCSSTSRLPTRTSSSGCAPRPRAGSRPPRASSPGSAGVLPPTGTGLRVHHRRDQPRQHLQGLRRAAHAH